MASMTIRVVELPDRSAAIVSICGVDLTFGSTPEALQWIAALAEHHKLTLTGIAARTAEVDVTKTIVIDPPRNSQQDTTPETR
jgi:hypothetical protein